MKQKIKIAVFTGNRAEYGLQFPILRALTSDERFDVYLLVGGAHLQEDFGNTKAEIMNDGFKIYREVEITMDHDTLYATAQVIGTGVLSVSRILNDLKPDWFIIYADRFESFAAIIAGTQMGIPTIHIEGGDYTDGGALDDTVRHAMTKLAHLHFATNEQAAERIRRMGEEAWRVYNIGQPSLDLAAAGEYTSESEILSNLNLDPKKPVILFCQHSITTEYEKAVPQVRPSIAALKRLAEEGNQVILTYPNNDAGGMRIIEEIRSSFPEKWLGLQIHKSLGRRRFHGVLNYIGRVGRGAFVGNSSALIKETPFFGCPAVNIGPRQRGRLRGNNVLDVSYDEQEIYRAIRRCIEDKVFQEQCAHCDNPYGAGNAGPRIAEVLATMPRDGRLIQKRMSY